MDLTDAIDHEIVMHRDAHFGGSFAEMIHYYENEDHIGIHPEIELERIIELQIYEKQTGDNLFFSLLDETEQEKVLASKKVYVDLKKIYEMKESSHYPRLIADLILSEEEEPTDILEAIVAAQKLLLPDLLRILHWDEAYDPLFPGYGYAPYFALQALCQIKDSRAIVALFETLRRETFFGEETIISALVAQGEEAKQFLLKRLKSRPLTDDNAYAAYAIAGFAPDKEIEQSALDLMKDQEVWQKPSLFAYLLCLCEENREFLRDLSHNPLLPQTLKKEIEQSIKT